MNKYVVFFRGINVGGKNSLPMKDLINILEALGYENVQTYIQSGNAVFSSRKTIGDNDIDVISKDILNEKGFEPKVLLLNIRQLQDAITNNPYSTDEGKALHFFFLDTQPDKPDLEKLNSLKLTSEEFKLIGKVFYLYAPDGIGRSKLAAAVEKSIGVAVTARNWNTVSKIASMIESS